VRDKEGTYVDILSKHVTNKSNLAGRTDNVRLDDLGNDVSKRSRK
jgi:hypothetical protein